MTAIRRVVDRPDQPAPVSFLAMVVAGHLPVYLVPALLAAAMGSLKITEPEGGLLTALEMTAFCIASVLWPTVLRMVGSSGRTLALGLLLGATLCNAASVFSSGLVLLASSRTVAGVFEGALVASAYEFIGQREDRRRLFARAFAWTIAASIVSFIVLPALTDRFGLRGAYGWVLVVTLALTALVIVRPVERSTPGAPAAEGHEFTLPALGVCATAALITFSDGLVWPFAQTIGERIGLTNQFIGVLLGASLFGGLLGSSIAKRWAGSARVALRLGLIGSGLAGLCIALADPHWLFITGILSKNLTLFLALPFFLAVAGDLDPTGSLAGRSGGFLLLGAGLGPAAGGLIANHSGFAVAGWSGLAGTAIAVASLAWISTNTPQSGG